MSLFARETIPASLLHDQWRDDGDASNGSDGEADFEDDTFTLKRYQLPCPVLSTYGCCAPSCRHQAVALSHAGLKSTSRVLEKPTSSRSR
jgi:hypothetical protein